MGRPTLTVIVPTVGRDSLTVTLKSLAFQPEAHVLEVLVEADSRTCEVEYPMLLWTLQQVPALDRLHSLSLRMDDVGPSAWGHPQRNLGMRRAAGEWIATLDDDDAWEPTALEAILSNVRASVSNLHVFRMQYAWNDQLLWVDPTPRYGNVGTPMMVVRNDPAILGTWGSRYCGDFDFLTSTIAKLPAGPADVVWHPEVIARIRPDVIA